MIPVFLTSIKTRDGVTLEGIYVKPKRKSDTALIWVHGLTSRFSSSQGLIKELSCRLTQKNIGYFKFSNRGHDIVYKDRGRKKFQGGAYEKFEECVNDIRATITLAKKLGHTKIILAGSSTGANKALYYIYRTRDPAVRKLILAAAVSDIPAGQKVLGKKKFFRGIRIARALKKDALMPHEFGIQTAGRYLSLHTLGSAEDVVPYHNPRANWKELKSVGIPILVAIGSCDEYLDRTPQSYINAFRAHATSTKHFSGVTIKGARHGFYKKEKELTKIIISWIAGVL